MADETNVGATREVMVAANNAAIEMMTAVFENLEHLPTTANADPTRVLFFPNGIEVIYLKVDGFLTEKIHGTVVVEIAGNKSIPPSTGLSSIMG